MRAVFDSDVLIDLLEGLPAAVHEFERYDQPTVSVISWIEVMVGAKRMDRERLARQFLEGFDVRAVTPEVAEQAATLRANTRTKVPDAIIWATARALNCVLVTRNTDDFPANDPMIRVPYTL